MARKVSIAACQFVIKPVKDFDAFAAQSVKPCRGMSHMTTLDGSAIDAEPRTGSHA